MYMDTNGNAGYVTTADTCTLDHTYHVRDESPIIISLDRGMPEMTGPEVYFDLSGCGAPQRLGWTTGTREGFLVLDRNGDGNITTGAEMFGNFTPYPGSPDRLAINGFEALAAFDLAENGGDEDGEITRNDDIFRHLRLWIDADHDGVSSPSELFRLSDLGIERLEIAAQESRRRDRYGNEFRYFARVALRERSGQLIYRWAVDVFLVHE